MATRKKATKRRPPTLQAQFNDLHELCWAYMDSQAQANKSLNALAARVAALEAPQPPAKIGSEADEWLTRRVIALEQVPQSSGLADLLGLPKRVEALERMVVQREEFLGNLPANLDEQCKRTDNACEMVASLVARVLTLEAKNTPTLQDWNRMVRRVDALENPLPRRFFGLLPPKTNGRHKES